MNANAANVRDRMALVKMGSWVLVTALLLQGASCRRLQCGPGTIEVERVCLPVDNSATETGQPTGSGSGQADQDGDGFTTREGDCDDENNAIHPDAVDYVGDGVDQNCDGLDGTDSDRDGIASIESGGADCDDADAATFPGATDRADDDTDQNCDGADGVDSDGDGVASYASGGEDCNDERDDVFPGMEEVVCDGVDNNCSGIADEDTICDWTVRFLDDSTSASHNHSYVVINTISDHKSSQRGRCEDIGYDIVVVDDDAEWSWIESLVESQTTSASGRYEFWLDYECFAGDCASPSNWQWSDTTVKWAPPWAFLEPRSDRECAYTSNTSSSGSPVIELGTIPCDGSMRVICEVAP